MIFEILDRGREHATSGAALCDFFECDLRTITAQIERERLAGAPICATTNGNRPGYYLAADEKELKDYCDALKHRAGRIFRTRQALLKAEPVKEDPEEDDAPILYAHPETRNYSAEIQELVKRTARAVAGNLQNDE